MSGKAYFMVRAEIAEPGDRAAFDRWYETEHLPDAVKKFGATRGWRCWSALEPTVHYAFYEFPDLAKAKAILDSPGLKSLIADFDRDWGARVKRSRDIIELAGGSAP